MDELQNQQNQQTPQGPQIKENFINKRIVIIVAVIIVLLLIGLGVWWQIKKNSDGPYYLPSDFSPAESEKQIQQDTTSAINNDLNSVNIESIDDSFKEIDADLNSL